MSELKCEWGFFFFVLGCGVCLGVCNPKVEGVKTFANPLRSALKTEMRSESERERGRDPGQAFKKRCRCKITTANALWVRDQRQHWVETGSTERDKERERESVCLSLRSLSKLI